MPKVVDPKQVEKAIEEAIQKGFIKPSPDDILIAINVKKWFPLRRSITEFFKGIRRYVRAVDGVTFTIKRGEIFCLAGESGCGKTTLGRTILGLEEITDGYLLYKPRKEIAEELEKLGFTPIYKDFYLMNLVFQDKRAFKLMRRDLQIVFQDPFGSLDPRMTIKDILMEPLVVHNLYTIEERIEKVKKALNDVKLVPPEDFMSRYPHQLSGGQRQRVVIARALMLDPQFIVADEPVSMLDVSIRAEILKLLLDLRASRGLTFVFITHDLALARYVCDRIAVMYLGKIVELGPVETVINSPMHPYTKALRAAIPEPDPSNRHRIREVPIKGEVPSAIFIPPGCRFHPRCVNYMEGVCEKEEPPMIEVEPDHYVACWLFTKEKPGSG